MLELCVFASKREFFLKNYLLYVAQVAPGVGVFVAIFCPTPGALARICHCSCDKCPWVPGGRPLGMAADTHIRGMQSDLNTRHHALYEEAVTLARCVSVQPSMTRIIQRQVHRNNAPATTPEDYYRINLTTDFLNHALMQLDSRFEDDVLVCYKEFSVIPSILLATDPIWKDNVREFSNHYRQDIPNYAGLPAKLLLWERTWKGKKDRREDILDSIGATLEKKLKRMLL